jgi:TRAP transporter TAXI family solute receptor
VIRRRTLLLAGPAVLAGCVTGYRGPAAKLAIGAGEQGGLYLEFAQLLAHEITAAVPGLACTVVPTAGSLDNAALLTAGRAQLGLMLADAALAVTHGQAPFATRQPLTALGRVYENYLQLIVRGDGPVRTVSDLAGRVCSVGAAGSGAALVGDRLLAVASLAAPPRIEHHALADAVAGLEDGTVDAMLWSGGVPTPLVAELDARIGIRLLALDWALPALRGRYGAVYDTIRVPPGAYRAVRDLPTIGVANLLVCRPDLPAGIADAVTTVLVTRADRLVPQQALGTQFLDIRAVIDTAGLALHPGAIAAYRRLHG